MQKTPVRELQVIIVKYCTGYWFLCLIYFAVVLLPSSSSFIFLSLPYYDNFSMCLVLIRAEQQDYTMYKTSALRRDTRKHDAVCLSPRIKSPRTSAKKSERSSIPRWAHSSLWHNVKHTNTNGLKKLFFPLLLSSIKCQLCFWLCYLYHLAGGMD